MIKMTEMMMKAIELINNGKEVYVSSMYGDILLDTADEAKNQLSEEDGCYFSYREKDGIHYFNVDAEGYWE